MEGDSMSNSEWCEYCRENELNGEEKLCPECQLEMENDEDYRSVEQRYL